MEAPQFLPSTVQTTGAPASVMAQPQAAAPQPVAYQAPPAPVAYSAPPVFTTQPDPAAYAPPKSAYQDAPQQVQAQQVQAQQLQAQQLQAQQAQAQQAQAQQLQAQQAQAQQAQQLQAQQAQHVQAQQVAPVQEAPLPQFPAQPVYVPPVAPAAWEQAAPPAPYEQPAAAQYAQLAYQAAPAQPTQPAQVMYQPTQPVAAQPVQQAYQQQAPTLASRMEFQPQPSPVVFEPEPDRRPVGAADIFAPQSAATPTEAPYLRGQQSSPVDNLPMSRPPVAPEFEMTRDSSLHPDSDLEYALQTVLDLGASDLHIAVNATPMIRVDGGLRELENSQVWNQAKVASALKSILTPAQLAIYEQALEFDFAYTLSAQARFRVNFYQQRDNMGAAFRLIPTGIKSLKELGVPDSIAEFAKLPRGLVLITGPTGSGKSTTLAGLIDIVNRTRADHIMTVEDPIEFLHVNHKSLINQREVGHDTHSFGAALKHVLRQDPDVILVGELRDLETISVALTAAETGHLVFATLHTSDAPQTIDRIIDVYPPHQQAQVRAQLSATLQGVVCQTLIKKASGRGRVVATEVLVRTSAVANLIREGKTFQIHSAMQAGRELGMHTIDQHLADLVTTGQITLEAAKEKSHDLEVLERLIAGSRAPTTNSHTNMADSMSYQGQQ